MTSFSSTSDNEGPLKERERDYRTPRTGCTGKRALGSIETAGPCSAARVPVFERESSIHHTRVCVR